MNDIKRDIIKEYMGEKTKLDIDEILDLLEENEDLRDVIFREREKEYHREDIMNEIDYLNERIETENENAGTETNELYDIDDDTIEEITDKYEDRLGDSEDWHYILQSVLEDFDIK